jgi:Mrp family chromosome partitioning ATPase/capsular polysaccharide biosynthesis protein
MSQENLVQFEDYVAAAKRRSRLIGVVVFVCVALALIATLAMPKAYTSESRVLVRPVIDPSDQTSEEVNIDTERGVARSLSVAGIAAATVGTDASPSSLLADLSVEPVLDSQILVFRFTAGDPEEAFEVADAFADAYLQFRTEEADSAKSQVKAALEAQRAELIQSRTDLLEEKRALPADAPEQVDLDSQLAVIEANESAIRTDLAQLGSVQVDAGTVIDAAEVPSSPSSPDLKLNLAAGVLVGLILGLLIAFIKERNALGGTRPDAPDEAAAPTPTPTPVAPQAPADRRSSTPIETVLAQAGVVSLGLVPRLTNDADAAPFDSVTMLNGHVGDRLRELDATLTARLAESGQRVLLVTTPERRGMTVGLAGSLAVTAAQSGREVLLVAGDLEQPTLHSRFQLTNDQGLAEALRGQRPLAQVMQGWGGYETLVIVTAGQVNPADGPLDEQVLRSRLAPLRDDFELLLIEAPPVLASVDALTLASVCDGAILAVDPRGSEPARIATAAAELQLRTPIIGSVMVEARSGRPNPPTPAAAGAVPTGPPL